MCPLHPLERSWLFNFSMGCQCQPYTFDIYHWIVIAYSTPTMPTTIVFIIYAITQGSSWILSTSWSFFRLMTTSFCVLIIFGIILHLPWLYIQCYVWFFVNFLFDHRNYWNKVYYHMCASSLRKTVILFLKGTRLFVRLLSGISN